MEEITEIETDLSYSESCYFVRYMGLDKIKLVAFADKASIGEFNKGE